MTQTPHIGAFVQHFLRNDEEPAAAIVTAVRQHDRGKHIIPELREVTVLTLTVFEPHYTREGVEATFGEEFDKFPGNFGGRAYWPTFA